MVTGVLVVDDQSLIRAGLVALIRAAPDLDVVGEAATGEAAVTIAADLRPDVVLMDIRMPGMDGVEATQRILAGAHQPRVLVLTTFDLDEYVYAALKAGASGFVLKDAPPERLLAAVHTVASGDTLFAPTVIKRLIDAYVDREERTESAAPQPDLDALTSREREVLRLVGTGMANAEIADQLVVSESTVKTHLNRTMTKLDLSSRAQAVVLAYETGLVTPKRDK
jgi:DNA-binding NarL/FixJ family response regulator